MPYTRHPYTFDRVVRLIISVLIILAILWLINRLSGVLLPFFVACLIAYIFEPFVKFNRKLLRLKGRGVAVAITLFESLFLFLLMLYFVIPLLMEEIVAMARVLKHYAETETEIPYVPSQIHSFIKRNIDFNTISDYITHEQLTKLAENTLSTSWSIITGSISMIITLIGWLIVFIYVIFIMIDYDRLAKGVQSMVPPRYRKEVYQLGSDIETSMNHYFRGQALVAFLVGILFCIGFSIIGLPMAIVLGLFVGFLNLVPYLQLLSFPITAFLCLVYTAAGNGDFWPIFGESLLVYIVVQIIQDMYLTPKIMGRVMGLNPAIILLSLSIWGSLLGFIGLIIALPLTTLLLSYYERYVISREYPNDGNNSPKDESDIHQREEAVDQAFETPIK